jgi:hypothetical protein
MLHDSCFVDISFSFLIASHFNCNSLYFSFFKSVSQSISTFFGEVGAFVGFDGIGASTAFGEIEDSKGFFDEDTPGGVI